MMTPDEKKEFSDVIVTAVVAALNVHRPPDDDNHGSDHTWVRARIEKEKQRAEFYRKASQTIFGTVIAAFLIWLGTKGVLFIQFLVKDG